MQNRIIALDIAKAICIVLVVLGHYVPENAPSWYMEIRKVIYTFHMPLFMFASGYIYIATRKDIGYGSFLLKKVKRLIIPYLATSAIIISFKLLSQGHAYVEHPVTVFSYVRMFYLPEAGYFLWFVWALMWMFVIIPFFKTKESRLALFVIVIILHIMPIQLTDVFCLKEVKGMLVYFMAAVVAFDFKDLQSFVISFNKYKSIGLIAIFVGVTSVLVATNAIEHNKAWGGVEQEFYAYVLNAMFPFIGILFIMEVSKLLERVKSERLLNALLITSAASYTIYLFNTTFMGFVKSLYVRLPFDSNLWYVFVVEAIVATCVGVIIPMILHRWVLKRYTVTRFLFGL